MKGIIKIINKNGDVILEKENMILNEGRKVVGSLFLKNICSISSMESSINSSGLVSEYIKYKFNRIALGIGGGLTTPEMTIKDFKEAGDGTNFYKSENPEIEINFNSGENPSIQFLINVDPIADIPATIRELGIVLRKEDSDESSDLLFSRVAFDDTPIGLETEFEIYYKIYF